MCKIGDILLIYNAKNEGKLVGMHPFIVLDDNNGVVSGMYTYDFIGLLLTSADTEEKKERLRKIEGNFPIAEDDKIMNTGKSDDNRYSFVEADQFFFFDKDKIKYIHLGKIEPDIYNLIIDFIQELSENGVTIQRICDKASKIKKTENKDEE